MALQGGGERRATTWPEVDGVTLERCKARNAQAFRAFIQCYERAVFALLSRMLGRGAHVQDFAQEVFLRAYRAFPGFDLAGEARPSTWLLTIAMRLAINARKNQARWAHQVSLETAADIASPSTPETERIRHEIGRAIEVAAGELSDDHRAAFVLAEFHGWTIAEIAKVLDTPENTVKTRLFRAREHLRLQLADLEKGTRQ